MGVTSVVIRVIRMTTENSEVVMSPACSPIVAVISATSPREIMPTPTVSASIGRKRHRSAPPPQPITFVASAIPIKLSKKSSEK